MNIFEIVGRCCRRFAVPPLKGGTSNSHHYDPLPTFECKLRNSRFLLTAGITLFSLIGLARSGNASSLSVLLTQSPTATLSGTAVDEQGAVVPDMNITLTNVETGFRRQVTTNGDGYFAISLLPPGPYTVQAQRQGFTTAEIRNVTLNVNDQVALKIQLKTGQISELVIIEGAPVVQSESATVGTLVDHQFVENLPLNGRSFNALIELTPGTVLSKATYPEQGQFSVNGQRPNANYFTVDGVGANVGVGNGVSLVQTAAGTVPAFSASGGLNNLVSVDALQEFRIQTSTYAPEFGRSPGAQVSLLTRSGTNQFHGTLFDYFRNDALDANDWFVNRLGLNKAPLRQNDFGGVFGGPIKKDRSFIFFSFEGLRLRLPQVGITQVPSVSTRQQVSQSMSPFLNAFPIPNGRDFVNGFGEFNATYSNPLNQDATSVRGDHTINSRLTIFGRYNYAPSQSFERGGGFRLSLNDLGVSSFKTETLTLGSTQVIRAGTSNDFRANYSRTRAGSSFHLDQFGGGVQPADEDLFGSFATSQTGLFSLGVGRASYIVGKNADNVQRQINVVDTLAILASSHQLKFGIDYRRLSPISDLTDYTLSVGFFSASAVIANNAGFVGVGAGRGRVFPVFTNFSGFAQDTWKATQRLTLTYGLRWELNPPFTEKNGNLPFTIIGLDNPATMTLAPKGTPLWKTAYDNFAPRFGVAYMFSQAKGLESVLRVGFGTFYDLGTGSAGNAVFGGYPYSGRSKNMFNVPFPLTREQATPPLLTLRPPYTSLSILDPHLELPRTYQGNISVEQALGGKQTLSASYVAAAGRRLLRTEILSGPLFGNPNFSGVSVSKNGASSDYHALQIQFQRRLSQGLQALASYTWSHSIDNSSNEFFSTLSVIKIAPDINRGSSDYDLRHACSMVLTYDLPALESKRSAGPILNGWSVDAIFRARSATPVDIIMNSGLAGLPYVIRPNLVSGLPLYIDDPSVAGGSRINRAAFTTPPPNQQGTLGRNSLRGFAMSQLDFALHRGFHLTERLNLQLRADFFNAFNHPNFADPDGVLDDGDLFGQSLKMLGRSLGGLNPLYQIGGPRSIQLALKLQF